MLTNAMIEPNRGGAGATDRYALLDRPAAIPAGAQLRDAIELFRGHASARFLAVVDGDGRPVGAVHERLVRDLLFSPFGHALLANPACSWSLGDYVRPCPEAEIDDSAEWESRRDGWQPLPPVYTRGVLGKYVKLVQSAAHGAVCG